MALANDDIAEGFEFNSRTVDRLYQKCRDFLGREPDSLIYYGNIQRHISNKIGYTKGLVGSYLVIGRAYYDLKIYDKAAKELYSGLYLINENDENDLRLKKILLLQELAINYEKTYNYSTSLELNKQALSISLDINDSLSTLDLYYNIAICQYRLKQYEDSKTSLKLSLIYAKALNDLKSESRAYNTYGLIYKQSKEYEKAIYFYKKALDTNEKLNQVIDTDIWLLNNIGSCFLDQKSFDSAQIYFNKALPLARQLDNVDMIKMVLNNLGNLNLAKENYKKAIAFYLESIQYAKPDVFDREYTRSIEQVAKAYQAISDYENAIYYKDQYIAQSESLEKTNDELSENIAQFRMRELEWELEKQQQAEQIYLVRRANFWFMVTMSLLAVILGLASYKAIRYYRGVRAVKRWLATDEI